MSYLNGLLGAFLLNAWLYLNLWVILSQENKQMFPFDSFWLHVFSSIQVSLFWLFIPLELPLLFHFWCDDFISTLLPWKHEKLLLYMNLKQKSCLMSNKWIMAMINGEHKIFQIRLTLSKWMWKMYFIFLTIIY